MKRILHLLTLAMMLLVSTLSVAQVVVGNQEYDIDYLTPKEYEIGGITFAGADNYDTRMILLVAGLQVGDQIRVPGDKLATAVDRLWKQGLFEDVQIYVTRIQGNMIFLEIELRSRPKLSMFSLDGVKKGDVDKLKEDMKIASGDEVFFEEVLCYEGAEDTFELRVKVPESVVKLAKTVQANGETHRVIPLTFKGSEGAQSARLFGFVYMMNY